MRTQNGARCATMPPATAVAYKCSQIARPHKTRRAHFMLITETKASCFCSSVAADDDAAKIVNQRHTA